MFALPDQRGDDNYNNEKSFNKYFLPKIKIEKYNVKIDGRIFYGQAINSSIKQYDEVRKNRTRWWLLNWLFIGFCLFWK